MILTLTAREEEKRRLTESKVLGEILDSKEEIVAGY
jgi:hypothetical protein